MRVAISGASGLIGSALAERLRADGHSVVRLVRQPKQVSGEDTALWDPLTGTVDAGLLTPLDAIVNLAGESIAERWTEAKKERIRQSRVESAHTLAALARRVNARVFISASAVGFYGDRGDVPLNEEAAHGAGFLASVCTAWEEAAAEATQVGTRVAIARFGVVLSTKGGALAQMLTPYRLGMGGPIGSGEQYISWVHIADAVDALCYILANEAATGPINITSPEPLSNKAFARTLGRVLGRPAIIPAPARMVRLALGEMAEELLLSSARALPEKLLKLGFVFRYPSLEAALRAELGY